MIAYDIFTLPNGLRVVHNYDHTTAMVTVNVLYDVGARDESPELTGMAHLFEHLMFGGSVNIPDFDAAIETAGGYNNAWTTNDYTNFYDIVPAVNAETAFWLESDRMLGLSFDPKSLEVQRNVVIEEFKQVCLNRPYGDLGHHLRSLLYRTHPYRYPTIGIDPSHIERVTDEDVRNFFYSHYAPNNAVLAVSGNISLDETRRLAEKWFSDIPRREIKPRSYSPEAPITEARRKIVYGHAPNTAVNITVPMSAYGAPGYIPADLITDILASGKSSRLQRELVMNNNLFVEADSSILGSDEPGYLLISAILSRTGAEAEAEAERILWDQLNRLSSETVSNEELERALNRFESNLTFGSLDCMAKAQSLAMSVMHSEDPNAIVGAYRGTTREIIHETAKSLFKPERSATLIYRPQSSEE